MTTKFATIPDTSAAAYPHDLLARLGQRIREVRQRSSMTQRELAEALGVRVGEPISRSTLGNYEMGRRPISAELLLLIADICGVPLQAFALNDTATVSETVLQAVQFQQPATTPIPSVTGEEALAFITQTLRTRPDAVPFVLEMIAAFVEEPSQG
jgi:transcriptional regulator with XRE-family HTH domain